MATYKEYRSTSLTVSSTSTTTDWYNKNFGTQSTLVQNQGSVDVYMYINDPGNDPIKIQSGKEVDLTEVGFDLPRVFSLHFALVSGTTAGSIQIVSVVK